MSGTDPFGGHHEVRDLSLELFPAGTQAATNLFPRNFVSGTLQASTARSKYIFSHKHFGHYADMLTTAKDSKYKTYFSEVDIHNNKDEMKSPAPPGVNFYNSPVSVTFVTSSLDSKNKRVFYQISPSQVSSGTYNQSIDSRLTTVSSGSTVYHDEAGIAQGWNSGLQ